MNHSPAGTMVKSKSAYAIKKRYNSDTSPVNPDAPTQKRRVEFDCNVRKISREPISVPNFSMLTLPTPVLTPVEAARLVYFNPEEEKELEIEPTTLPQLDGIAQNETEPEQDELEECGYENFRMVKRGESYSSHLAYADNPLYQHSIEQNVPEALDEHLSSTSDYASIETVNRLSSASSYSVKTGHAQTIKDTKQQGEGPFGFCNPNYMGPDIKALLHSETIAKKHMAKMLNTPDSLLEDSSELRNSEENLLELQNYNGTLTRNSKVFYRHSAREKKTPKSLALHNTSSQKNKETKFRSSSAGRVERKIDRTKTQVDFRASEEPFVPLYVYIIGGKEHGQVTVFQRPLSIWKLKLF